MPYQFSNQEYADIIFVYGFCDGNGRAAVREYRRRFPRRRIPNHTTFSNVFLYTREHGQFPRQAIVEHRVRVDAREEENIINIVQNNPRTSTRRVARILNNIPQTRVERVLQNEGLYPFHIQVVQRLEPGDEIRRMAHCQWILRNRRVLYRTLFTDEAQFTRDGVNNSRNTHLWANENPRGTRRAHSQHRFSVNVWAAMIDRKLIGPHFFEGRLTSAIYLNFLQNILPLLLRNQNVEIRGMFFQHDGAPPHFSRDIIDFLNQQYPNRWIGRGGPQPWPARSPDFNPLDYYLWGHMKNRVYDEEITTREQLVNKINAVFEELRNNPDVIRRSIMQLTLRAQKCQEADGGHFENNL